MWIMHVLCYKRYLVAMLIQEFPFQLEYFFLSTSVQIPIVNGYNPQPCLSMNPQLLFTGFTQEQCRGADYAPVQICEDFVVSLGRIFHLVLQTGLSPHGLHLIRMGPGPFHFGGQVIGIPSRKVQSGTAILNDFLHGSQSRADDGRTAGEAFGDRQGEGFVTLARHDEATSAPQPRQSLRARYLTQKGDESQAKRGGLHLESLALRTLSEDHERNAVPQSIPSCQERIQAFFPREPPHEDCVFPGAQVHSRIGINEV